MVWSDLAPGGRRAGAGAPGPPLPAIDVLVWWPSGERPPRHRRRRRPGRPLLVAPLLARPDLEIVAVADSDRRRAGAALAAAGAAAPVFAGLEDALAATRPDVAGVL